MDYGVDVLSQGFESNIDSICWHVTCNACLCGLLQSARYVRYGFVCEYYVFVVCHRVVLTSGASIVMVGSGCIFVYVVANEV